MENKILIVAEHRGGSIKNITYEMIVESNRLLKQVGGTTEVCVMGNVPDDQVTVLGHYGASKVYVLQSPEIESYSAEGYVNILSDLVKKTNPVAVFMGATAQGVDYAPRLAARLNTGLVSDCTGVELSENNKLVFTRPIYAGKVLAKVTMDNSSPQLATLRPNVFQANTPDTSKSIEIEKMDLVPGEIRAKLIDFVKKVSGRPELTEAKYIVSGGRGMKNPENFKILEELADTINAAVGASRAVVDAGWRDHSDQVGQTGKVVSPVVYIACAISGAIQHLAGMSSSKIIVAINKDPDAPIFKKADYGIVGDVFQVVPLLKKEFEKLMEQD